MNNYKIDVESLMDLFQDMGVNILDVEVTYDEDTNYLEVSYDGYDYILTK